MTESDIDPKLLEILVCPVTKATLRTYAEAGREAEHWPTPELVTQLRARGVRHIWGWPYFLIDEIDDGYSGGTRLGARKRRGPRDDRAGPVEASPDVRLRRIARSHPIAP